MGQDACCERAGAAALLWTDLPVGYAVHMDAVDQRIGVLALGSAHEQVYFMTAPLTREGESETLVKSGWQAGMGGKQRLDGSTGAGRPFEACCKLRDVRSDPAFRDGVEALPCKQCAPQLSGRFARRLRSFRRAQRNGVAPPSQWYESIDALKRINVI